MSEDNDWPAVVLGVIAFTLPLTLLVPGFSIWSVVPKVHVERYLLIGQHLSWNQVNTAIVTLLVCFFSLYLELRKRKLDDMLEKVLTVSQKTDTAMEVEVDRQAAAVRACVELLDASAEHYENLALLRDELRKREKLKGQHPPVIEASSSTL